MEAEGFAALHLQNGWGIFWPAAAAGTAPGMQCMKFVGALATVAVALGSPAAHAQMRTYGDPYSGAFQTITQQQQQSQVTSYRTDYSTPSFRVEQQIWRPSTPSYGTSGRSSSTGSDAPPIRYVPEKFLVPYGDGPGDGHLPEFNGYDESLKILARVGRGSQASQTGGAAPAAELWDLYLAQGPGNGPQIAVTLAQARAATGDSEAMLLLALASYQGRGLPADLKRSFDWMSRAAQAQNLTAQVFLGDMYLNGVGVAADKMRGLDWLRRAADAGEPHAALRYARALLDEDGDRNFALALRYAEQAQATLPEAGLQVGMILSTERPGVAPDMPRAAAAFRRAAEAGEPLSQFMYGVCLQTGSGVSPDAAGAIPWLQRASDRGVSMAQMRLGQAYYDGFGVTADYPRALGLLEKAAAAGEPGAYNLLGVYFMDGRAAPKDASRAVGYFRKGAELGNAGAQFNLAAAYGMGDGVAKDLREETRWLLLAADGDHAMALFVAGLASLDGYGVPRDDALAVRRLQRSAARGHVPALNVLCDLATETNGIVRFESAEFTPTLQAGVAQNQPACLYVQAARLTKGIQGPQDLDQALDLLMTSAEAGYGGAEYEVALIFLGDGGRGNAGGNAQMLQAARVLLTRAAKRGIQKADQLLAERGWR